MTTDRRGRRCIRASSCWTSPARLRRSRSPSGSALAVTTSGCSRPGAARWTSSSGVTLSTRPLRHRSLDTIIVSGARSSAPRLRQRAIVTWLKRAKARRIASVCSGAFLLAEAGRLDGRRATTHWGSTDHFRRLYPQVTLEPDRIFVRDGEIWTSAGITAGIDLALALVEDDLGPDIARQTAQQLVVHQRRPGGQSQFSGLVETGGRTGRFAELIEWMRAHLAEALTVERLADHAAMSPRHFARAFTDGDGDDAGKGRGALPAGDGPRSARAQPRIARADCRVRLASAIPGACDARSCARLASRRRRCAAWHGARFSRQSDERGTRPCRQGSTIVSPLERRRGEHAMCMTCAHRSSLDLRLMHIARCAFVNLSRSLTGCWTVRMGI